VKVDVSPPRAGRREWIGLAVLALPCILATMDLTVLNLAVPHLSADLKPSASQLLWIVDIYGFLIAGSLITMGTLGDRIGRRRLLMIGAVAFGVASILAAFSRSAAMLIATRALLGVAGATLAPSTLSLIRNMFLDPRQRTVAIGVWATCFSVGAAIGPLLGGVLLEHFWWGSVFLLNVPVMALLLVLGPLLLPEFRDPKAGRLDLTSAAMSVSAVLLMIYGLKKIAEAGFSASHGAFIAAGAVLGALFIHRQKRLDDPLIDLSLFRAPAFSAALALNLLGCFIAFGAFLFVSQHLQLVLGLSPLKAGLVTMPSSFGFLLGSMLSPLLVRRLRPATVIAGGMAISGAGFGLLTLVTGTSGTPLIMAASFIYSLGMAPVFTLGTDLIVGSAPAERAGAAASISETSNEFGGALGMAVLGSIGTAAYTRRMAAFVGAGLPPEAIKAARGTLGGAVGVAETLGPDAGAALLVTARDAFASGLHLTAMVSVVIAIVMVAVALGVLRRVGPPAAAKS